MQSSYANHVIARTAAAQMGRLWQLAALAAFLLALGIAVPDRIASILLLTTAATLGILSLGLGFAARRYLSDTQTTELVLADFIEHDGSPSFTTDLDGVVHTRNAAARERFGGQGSANETLVRALRDLFANPAALLTRLQARAEARGAAREDVVTRKGHVRLAVHRVGEERFLWRLEDLVERSSSGRGAESLSLPMMTVSKSGTILFMNDALRRLLGGRVKTLQQVFGLGRTGNLAGEQMVQGVDGPVRARIVDIEGTGGRREIFMIPSDGRSALAATDLSSMLDAVPAATMRLSRNGNVLSVNSQARVLLGGEAAPGMRLPNLVEGLGRPIVDWLEDAAQGRGLGKAEVVRASHAEQETYLQISLGRIEEDGEVLLLAVLTDATELKSLEAQFVQSQKMQAIGQLAGGVAHDFNNLLTAISGHCDLLLLRHDEGDPDYADLVQINQNSNRAASLVGQLLAFSRKQTLQPRLLDLSDTLSDLTHLLNRLVGERIALRLHHSEDAMCVRADKRQLEQVIMNLVVNARDALPGGGEIRIETEQTTLSEPLERDRASVPAGDYMVVRVCDTGVGIPPERLSKIFEPFFTTKRTGEGTGLGLSTAYGIVKQTGGFIFADSVSGVGSTFTLYLPAVEETLPASETEAAPTVQVAANQGDGVVLLVEDEAPVRAFASRALRLRGYTVIEAENAEEALKTLEDGELRVDVFVTDVIMPGMDGPTWVRAALKDRPDAKVVFVSGYAEDSFADEQARIPNSVFLPKPFSLSDLTTTVHNQIH